MDIKTFGFIGVLLTLNSPCFSSVDVQSMHVDNLIEGSKVLDYINDIGRSERFLDLAAQKGSLKAQVKLTSHIRDLDQKFEEYDRLIKKGSVDALYEKAELLNQLPIPGARSTYSRAFMSKYPYGESRNNYIDSLLLKALQGGVTQAAYLINDNKKKLLAADNASLYSIVFQVLSNIDSNISKSISIFESLRGRPLSAIEYKNLANEAQPLLSFDSKLYETNLYLLNKACELGNQESCNILSYSYASGPWAYMDLDKSIKLAKRLSVWPSNLSWAATVGLIPKPDANVTLYLPKEIKLFSQIINDPNHRNFYGAYRDAINDELLDFRQDIEHQKYKQSMLDLLEEYPDNPKALELLAYGYLHEGNFEKGYYYLNKLYLIAPSDTILRTSVNKVRHYLFIMTHEGIGCDKNENKAWLEFGENTGRLYALRSLATGDPKTIVAPIVREAISHDEFLKTFDLIGLEPKVDNLIKIKYLLSTQEDLVDMSAKILEEFFAVQDGLQEDGKIDLTKGGEDDNLRLAQFHSLRLEKLNELFTISNMLVDKGNSKGLYILGLLQMRMANLNESKTLFQKAASSGCIEAYSELAKIYFNGLGTEPSVQKAVEQLEAKGMTRSNAYVELAKISNNIYFTDLHSWLLTEALQSDSKNINAWKMLVDEIETFNIYDDIDYGLKVLGKACDVAAGDFCKRYKQLKRY